MSKNYNVFVYGTLMKGFDGYKKYMCKGNYITEGSLKGIMYHTGSGYPAVIYNTKKGGEVSGELYSVDENLMKDLRRYEGIGSLLTCYEEKLVKIQTKDGDIPARVFVVSPFWKNLIKLSGVLVSNGDWKKFVTAPPKKAWQTIAPAILFFVSFIFVFQIIFKITG
ncbi:gamma-glutamylcyclotransferase family protein [Flexistipes sp.]|uniref:gamma-glutamylcyclotransferase family protein n=1 Tax=Flexistipes sp. TaxID=3088135 RepID=UPI002E1C1C9F|nr:gamma-glutamylcyclotransferase family protein [Flexistipes sp.]